MLIMASKGHIFGALCPKEARIGQNLGFSLFCKQFHWIQMIFLAHWNYF